MAEKAKELSVNIGLRSIEIRNLSINKPIEQTVSNDELAFNVKIEQRLAPSDKMLVVTTIISILELKTQIQHATIGIDFGFSIGNYDEIFYKDDSPNTKVPEQLAEIVNSLAVGTARGILFSELKGTYLKNIILPIIDPVQLKPEIKIKH